MNEKNNQDKSLPPGFIQHPVHFLALGFGSGYMPRMPGTAGTVVGVICYLPISGLGLLAYISLVFVLFILGVALCHKTATDLAVHDHGAIVWDEMVGYLVTMIAAPAGWAWIIAGFVLFRLFDIWKPWPINWSDRAVSGGIGIMLDDVFAAVYAMAILQISAYLLYSYS